MKMNMKKIISWGMMLAAAFTLTNCAKEMDAPVQEPESNGYPFEIVASTVDTKTVNDGMSTKWAEGDKLNVFHALGDDTNYVNDGAFTVSDVEAGVFTGTIAEELDVEEEYDWFALYPYSEQVTTPAATSAGYTYIGHSKGLNQTGYDSMASLKGSVCPLYGVLKYGGVKPELEMQHLSSVIAINVTNDTDEPLTITTASFTAPEAIVGSFYINFTDKDNVVYTASEGYSLNTAVVNVTEGTALERGESAVLYLAIKPFTAAAGEKLTLAVNRYSKEITLAKEAVFTAGKIKTVNFSYDKVVEPAPEGVINATLTFDDKAKRTEYTTQIQVWEENGITLTNNKSTSTSNVGDYYKPARFYKSSEVIVKAPANIVAIEFDCTGIDASYVTPWASIDGATVSNSIVTFTLDGTSDEYTFKTPAQLRANSVTVKYVGNGEGGETPEPEPEPEPEEPEEPESEVLTVAEFINKEVDDNVYYTLSGTITSVANTSYGNFDLTDDTGTVYIYGLCSPDGATNKYWATSGAKLGDDIVISVSRSEFNGEAQGKNARFIELISPGTRAFYTLSTEAVDFSSTGGEQVVKVTAYNTSAAVTASSDNSQFAVGVDGYNVTISSAANELEEAVTGNVTINVGNLEPTVVKVTLAAKPANGEVEGGSDDFHTISSTNASYVTGKTTAGWNYKNCAIFKGGTSDSSPSFMMIGDASNRALCMNGKTSAVGTITSPTFTTGCGTLKFNYGLPFGDTKIKFRVDIKQGGAVVKTFTINKTSATKLTKYSHEEAINVAGDFQIVFTNLSPSNSTSNKDRTAIWDVEWNGYSN